jgi:hypothetical protein
MVSQGANEVRLQPRKRNSVGWPRSQQDVESRWRGVRIKRSEPVGQGQTVRGGQEERAAPALQK